jgi:hypothetical protein
LTKQHWPHLRKSGEYYDSAGTPFDPELHVRKRGAPPSVNKNGTFRKKRRKPQAAPKSEPLKENQLLAAFKNHVEQAKKIARLNELSTLAGMMNFTIEEQEQAQDWVREKRKTLEAAADVG